MKPDRPAIGCVVLAAGNAERFGSNKLLAEIDGKALIERAFDAIPTDRIDAVSVVTQYDGIEALAEKNGFRTVFNRRPELGLSRSVRLGTAALRESCDGILYLVADQPWLKRGSVSEMLDIFLEHPDHIVALSHGGKRGNPCIFPKQYFDELCALSGDRGGRSVIERHADDLLLYEASGSELKDIDTPEDISDIE